MSNWQYLPQVDQPGAPVRANGGAGAAALTFRGNLDARRSMQGDRVPSAEYPDGYLATIQSRREDRLLDSLKTRLTQRSYQRGVHKGEKVDQADYFWPDEFNMETGLEYESRGLKWRAKGSLGVERLVNGGTITSPAEMAALREQHGVSDSSQPDYINPERAARLRSLVPGWR